jgi:hypothetical protein
MRKILVLFIGLLGTSYSIAQDITDALRYAREDIQGTARFKAMSGAFGALGGDMSSVNINPAGAAIFSNSHVAISSGVFHNSNDVTYFNTISTATSSYLDFNQFGAAFTYKNTDTGSKWKKFTLSAAFDTTANHNNEWLATGVNTKSLDSYFLYFTNTSNISFGTLKLQPGELIENAYADIGTIPDIGYASQQAFLGYWAGIIDPENLDNTTNDNETNYNSNIQPGSFNQKYLNAERGYNGKLAFNFAGNYNDRVYFGVNLNTHFINYEKFTRLEETNSNESSLVNALHFENLLRTTGSGFSFQLGTIIKLTSQLRAGLSYNSPTWYYINEELIQDINSNNADSEIGYISDVINIYPEYRLETPGKITGSLAYIFGQKGLLSFDYSLKDFSQTRFKPSSDPSFSIVNSTINETLDTAVSYRIGGEYRIKAYRFRAGYRFEESPYKTNTGYGDLEGYSLGIGYTFGDFNLDFAFSQAQRDNNPQLYNVGLTDTALVQTKFTDLVLTLGFRI